MSTAASAPVTTAPGAGAASPSPSPYSRKNPFPAALVTNRLLSADGSGKEIRHHEISVAGSGLTYEAGDSLGVFPTNDPRLVDELLAALGASGDEEVFGPDGEGTSLRTALLRDYAVTLPSKEFLAALAAKTPGDSVVATLLNDPLRKEDLAKYLYGMETIDFLHAHPSVRWTTEEFVGSLRKLQPRLYSIASSPRMFPELVHLTVATVRYDTHGRRRHGVASTFLAERLDHPETVPVFFHSARHFRLPADGATPIVMVGPGTGIAPFRAYLQDRAASGATGRNWLFFGDQRERFDYLYRDELEGWQKNGLLTHLHTAFSRDQEHKVYVQHRMLEHAAELWRWLEEGAHFYVCGDAQRMAKDVDAALHRVVETAGNKTPAEAAQYVEALKKAKRYKRDVY